MLWRGLGFLSLSLVAHAAVVVCVPWSMEPPVLSAPSAKSPRVALRQLHLPAAPTSENSVPKGSVPPTQVRPPTPTTDHAPAAAQNDTVSAPSVQAPAEEGRGDEATAEVSPSVSAAQVATDEEQRCWRAVGKLLQERATTSLPAALRRRGLRGEVLLRFRLDERGRAVAIQIEQRQGAALLEEAAASLLREPFALACPGEGRWPVVFAPPSPSKEELY